MKKWRSKEWLIEHYVEQGLTTYECGEIAGCTGACIAQWMRRYKIKSRKGKKRVSVRCRNCGVEHVVPKGSVEEGAEFCSHDCWVEYYKREIREDARSCLSCGKSFHPDHNKREYCCLQCFKDSFDGHIIEGSCLQCGGYTKKYKVHLNSENLFCNWDCYAEYRKTSGILTGHRHPMYKGGFDWERHGWNRTDEGIAWREAVEKRDVYCVMCGAPENLVAHHVVPTRIAIELRADPENGVLLCKKCHGELHYTEPTEFAHLLNEDYQPEA